MKRHNEKTLIMCYTLSKNSWNQFWQLGTWYQSNRSINLEKFCRKTHCFNLAWYSLDRVMQNFKLERFVYHSPNTSVCPTYRKWLIKSRRGKTGGSGQSGLRVKRVTDQNGSFLNGLTRLRVNRVSGRVGLTRIFQTFFFVFFFQLQKD